MNEKINVEEILESLVSTLIIEQRKTNFFIVGVPHHAPAGQKTLPCLEHPNSDENVGFLGRYLAEKLECHNIIASYYTLDVNKCINSDYTTQIIKWCPNVLIEIHGYGNTKTNFDIEISSGIKNRKKSEKLVKIFKKKLVNFKEFDDLALTINGEYKKLILQASEAVTINNVRWIPVHIELPSSLRIHSSNRGKPPIEGYQFCDCLFEALKEMFIDSPKK